jgi:hypothetical protein
MPSKRYIYRVFLTFWPRAEGAIHTLICSALLLQHIGEKIYTLIGLPTEVAVEQTVIGAGLVKEKFVVVWPTIPTKS